jgi:hypothetical protein
MLIQELFSHVKKGSGVLEPSRTSLEKTAEYIRNNCQQYLAACNTAGDFLYRGFDNKNGYPAADEVFIGIPSNNRSPSGLTDDQQDKLNKVFKALGFYATRNRIISCSGNLLQAKDFGSHTFIIFPLDGFRFTWSPKVDDVGSYGGQHEISGLDPEIKQVFNQLDDDIQITKKTAIAFNNILGFTDKDLVAAIKSKNEVVIAGKYVAVRSDIGFEEYLEDED